jgi:hypothetical protein
MIRSHRAVTSLLLALLATPLGCSDQGSVNIGNTQKLGGRLSDYAATWSGYAQAYVFSDGTDHVRLTIDSAGQGTLVVGDAAAPPPATDAHVGYPPASALGTVTSPFPGITGFPYPLHATRVESDRIQVGIDVNDAYSAWCALQTPVPARNVLGTDPGYYCGPALTGDLVKLSRPAPTDPDPTSCVLYYLDGTTQAVNCDWFTLCALGPVCTCSATACAAATQPAGTPVNQYSFEIDGELDATGSTLKGTLSAGRVIVILNRQN